MQKIICTFLRTNTEYSFTFTVSSCKGAFDDNIALKYSSRRLSSPVYLSLDWRAVSCIVAMPGRLSFQLIYGADKKAEFRID